MHAAPLALAALALPLLWAWPDPAPPTPRPRAEVLLELEADGSLRSGSLGDLIAAVRSGEPVRVGWTLDVQFPDDEANRTLEHWCPAEFLTIWEGQVFAQVDDICSQGMIVGGDTPGFHLDPAPHGWVALIGTTGEMKQAFQGEPSTMRVATRWAVVR